MAYIRECRDGHPANLEDKMILVKVFFGEEFFRANSDIRTMNNVCNDADFSGDSFGYFEAIYAGF